MSNRSKYEHASPSGAILPENYHFPRTEGQPIVSAQKRSTTNTCCEPDCSNYAPEGYMCPECSGIGPYLRDPGKGVHLMDTPSATCPNGQVAQGVELVDTLPVDDIDTKGPPFLGTLQPTLDRRTLRPVSSADTKGTQEKVTSERRTPSRFTPDHREGWVKAYLAGRLVANTTPARGGAASLICFPRQEVSHV